jgi:2'-5' RNA ligase
MLKQLAVEIEEGMVSLGFSREEKAFNPHLTVGRIKFIQNKIAFNILVNEFKNSDIQDVKVSEVIFYQSILNYEGPIYKPINILNLI